MRGGVRVSLAAGLLLLGASPLAGATPLPSSWGGSVAVGYGWNILGSSEAESEAFDTGDPDYHFVVDRLDDGGGEASLWGRWDVPSFYKTLRVRASYGVSAWAHNDILRTSRAELDLRQKLADGSRLDLSLVYEPQVYLRHRVDKDALPGQPRFRPEAYRGTEAELEYTRPLGSLELGGFVGYQNERRTPWFRERDESRWLGGLNLTIPFSTQASATALAGFARTRSRNEPDLGTDRSHREVIGGLRAAVEIGSSKAWRIEAGTKWKFRTYTTDDPEDDSRYGRHDQTYTWSARVARRIGHWSPFARLESSGRFVDLPVGGSTADEEGEYQETAVQAGVEWEF